MLTHNQIHDGIYYPFAHIILHDAAYDTQIFITHDCNIIQTPRQVIADYQSFYEEF